MTIEEVLKRIEDIKALAERHDNEAAHDREDALWADVLLAISTGAPHAPELAETALNTKYISFTRWYA